MTGAPRSTVVGLGESTRLAHETFDLRDRIFRRLVERHGFRGLALQDSAGVGAVLDAYVTGAVDAPATAEAALDGAWGPWRSAETAVVLDWIHAFNREHAHDPVRIFGVKPAQAEPATYAAVLKHVRATAPHLFDDLAAHLEPIRTAHAIDEHVQRARGLYLGRPFAEHAREALAIVAQLPEGAGREPERLMRLIVDFHEQSVAGRQTYAGDAGAWAATIIDHERRTGHRVAYWDGIAHTAATPVTLGLDPERGAQPTVGSVLREHYGARYVSVAIGFHHGAVGAVEVPAPNPDWLDARLTADIGDSPTRSLDLRVAEHRRRYAGPARARVISGVYDPARDEAEHLEVADLPAAFDILVHVHEVTPTRPIGTRPPLRPDPGRQVAGTERAAMITIPAAGSTQAVSEG